MNIKVLLIEDNPFADLFADAPGRVCARTG